jgi:hypothetical protein
MYNAKDIWVPHLFSFFHMVKRINIIEKKTQDISMGIAKVQDWLGHSDISTTRMYDTCRSRGVI